MACCKLSPNAVGALGLLPGLSCLDLVGCVDGVTPRAMQLLSRSQVVLQRCTQALAARLFPGEAHTCCWLHAALAVLEYRRYVLKVASSLIQCCLDLELVPVSLLCMAMRQILD